MPVNTAVPLCFALALAAVGGCSAQPSATPATPQSAAAQAVQPAAAPASPSAGTVETITGTVLETMDAASYTYVRVKSGSREVWAASSQFKVAVGDTLVVPLETPMENFHSQSLNRDFPLIYFSSRIGREGEPAAPAMAVGHAPMGGAAAGGPMAGMKQDEPVTVTEPIAQPAGGTAVAEVWANRNALAGKEVTVRGKVVKVNAQIMGRNWLHIQDGTGQADKGTHDLTVTSSATAKKGDVVTVTGTLGVDKDFTAGYKYPVILEGATIR